MRGEMGAGKTTLVAEVVKLLDPAARPCSPTFAIINQYNEHLYHADLYRLRGPEQIADTGLGDLCVPGNYVFIEWPGELAFSNAMTVTITVQEDGTREFIID